MTDEEVLKLKPGDTVRAYINNQDRAAIVIRVYKTERGAIRVVCRRAGTTASGGRFPSVSRLSLSVERHDDLDTVPANVYADFLDERGFTEAAACLRLEFPLANGTEEPQ